jgi:glycosyltransferase involved in cell wall biosynthesis
MSKVSVVMPAYNAGKHLAEAIESVLAQSFTDFELIVVDDGSTDNTCSIVKSYADKRIVLQQNEHDFVGSLNLGVSMATSKYVARMDADDVMHVERLKIQHAIMEDEPEVTVCASEMMFFGENKKAPFYKPTGAAGLVEQPLLQLLRGNVIAHPTVMMRKDFLLKMDLQYERYAYAEDYKLWTEIAKRGGVFYVESQPLLYYRVSEGQVSSTKREEQRKTAAAIKLEVAEHLIAKNAAQYPELQNMLEALKVLGNQGLMQGNDIAAFVYSLFTRNKNTLTGV